MEKLVAKIVKSEAEDVCICLTEYHGRHFVDVRVFAVDPNSGDREPTSRGFSLDIGQLQDLLHGLQEADAAIEAAGLRVPPPDIDEDGSESLADIMRAAQALRQMRASDAPPLPVNRESPPPRPAMPSMPPPARPMPAEVPRRQEPALVGADVGGAGAPEPVAEASEAAERPVGADHGLARVIESLKMVQHHIGGR